MLGQRLVDVSVCYFAFVSAADTCEVYFKPFDNRCALLSSSMAAHEQSVDQLEKW